MIGRAVNAVRMGVDWRPVVGLTRRHEGSVIERVLAWVVVDRAVEENNKEIEKANRG